MNGLIINVYIEMWGLKFLLNRNFTWLLTIWFLWKQYEFIFKNNFEEIPLGFCLPLVNSSIDSWTFILSKHSEIVKKCLRACKLQECQQQPIKVHTEIKKNDFDTIAWNIHIVLYSVIIRWAYMYECMTQVNYNKTSLFYTLN